MIELRNYKRMHVPYRVSRTRDLVSARRVYTDQSRGRVYEIKTLRSNLAPEEGEGRLFEGGVYSSKYGTYSRENAALKPLVWGSLTLAPIMVRTWYDCHPRAALGHTKIRKSTGSRPHACI